MKHLSLFSGIGGLDLAAEWAGFETVAFVERDPYCQRVLAKRWPGVPIIDDVRQVADTAGAGSGGVSGGGQSRQPRTWGDGAPIRLVSGGFPCQPHSVAGKRKASADDRDLWPEFARVIREIRPRWVVAENVPGLLHSESGRFFGAILGDLADMGYSAGWGVWGAADVGALHQRDRVFIVGYAASFGLDAAPATRPGEHQGQRSSAAGRSSIPAPSLAYADEPGSQGHGRLRERAHQWLTWEGHRPLEGIWESEPPVDRVASGVPARVDRLRALGNAVVPQQAYPLFKAIAEIEMSRNVHSQFHSEKP